MKIFLIGFMGSGKTTFGRKLASSLNFSFYDLDELAEKKAGMSIREYFSESGEEAFRRLEKESLQETAFDENSVVATGGGAPCYSDNMDWMNKNGTTAYIYMPPLALADRLKHGQAKRPLIKDFNREQLIEFITTKLIEREPCYGEAKVIINGLDLTPEKFIEALKST